MQRQDIKSILTRYFETPEINNRIKGYLRDKNLTYEDINNDQLVKMLEDLSLVDTISEKMEAANTHIDMVDVSPNKKCLTLKIIRGKAFVDMEDLPKDTKFSISLCFLNRRYRTASIPVSIQPFIGQSFEMRLPKEELSVGNRNPIELALTVEHSNGSRSIYSVKQIEWRFVLAFGSITFDVQLAAFKQSSIGQARSVGILSMTLDLYPKIKRDLISERLLNSQLAMEKKTKQQAVDAYFEYASSFWNDYKSIHYSFNNRLMKIYGESQDKILIPMCKFVHPLYNVRGIDSPFHALRFVSLIPYAKPQLNIKPVYKRFHTFLASGTGTVEDHCHLLCSLLLGFGLTAYVCWGVSQKGEHKWVMTQDKNGVCFWQAESGLRFQSTSEKALKQYRSVTMLYNHQHFLANIQIDETLPATQFRLEDETKWKRMSNKDINSLPPYNQQISLLHPTLNCYQIQEAIEDQLMMKIEEYRKEYGLPCRHDPKLSSVLSMALANYEAERVTETTFGQKQFQSSIKSQIPEKHTFKAFPIQLFERDPSRIFNILKDNRQAQQVILIRGDSVNFGLRTKLVVYPDNYFVLWLSLAVRYYKLF